jgi:ATP-dependent DNA ligase
MTTLQRLGTRPSAQLLARVPVSYVVFDLLHFDDQPTTALTCLERRWLLTELAIAHSRLLVPGHQVDVDALRSQGSRLPITRRISLVRRSGEAGPAGSYQR